MLGTEIPGSAETATQLETVGVPVYLIDPHGLGGILHSVDSIGQALNRGPQAAALNLTLARRIEAVKARTAGKPAPRILVAVWYDPIITIGKHAFITEILEAAGAKSITDDLLPDWPQVSMEALIARAPEALVLVRDARSTWRRFRSCPVGAAWRRSAGKVYYVDKGIEEPSPVAINALEELAREFHP